MRLLQGVHQSWRASHSSSCFSASSLPMPYEFWILPTSWSRLPATVSRSSSVSLPHCSFTLPFACFQFPAMRSQFMSSLYRSGWVLYTEEQDLEMPLNAARSRGRNRERNRTTCVSRALRILYARPVWSNSAGFAMRNGTARARRRLSSRSARSLVTSTSARAASAASTNFWSSGSRHCGRVPRPGGGGAPRALGGGKRALEALREAPRLRERGSLGASVDAVLAEVVGEHPLELGSAGG